LPELFSLLLLGGKKNKPFSLSQHSSAGSIFICSKNNGHKISTSKLFIFVSLFWQMGNSTTKVQDHNHDDNERSRNNKRVKTNSFSSVLANDDMMGPTFRRKKVS
jgi:hypothetical protein